MRIIYNLGILLFGLSASILALKKPKAKLWKQGRKHLLKNVKQAINPNDEIIWVHCASLGEFEQGRPLIEALRKKHPQKKILLTFFSPSGYENQKNYKGADYIFYLPLDLPIRVKRFVNAINPEVVFFIKYEYWYNLLRTLKKKGIPIYYVSAIFRKDQAFFKWYGKWYSKLLTFANHFFVQNTVSEEILHSLGISNVTVSGDTRFDRVNNIIASVQPLTIVEQFLNGQKAIIAGSSWKAEEAMLLQFSRNHEQQKFIIAPHEVNEPNINRLMMQFGDKAIRYSKVSKATNLQQYQILIIDCYGLLTSLYQYGKVAFIGGGFGVGIHNILEAATFGMPILFGPNYEKFQEAKELIEHRCAFPIENIEEFNIKLTFMLANEEFTKEASNRASQYVQENVGATQIVLKKVFA